MLHTLGSRFRQLTDEMAAHETIILQCRVRCRGVSVMALVAAAGITTYLTTHRITSPPSRTSVNSGTVWSLPLIPRVNVCIRSPRRNGRWRWQRTSNWAGKCGGSTVQFKKHPKILYITACFSVHAVSQNVCLWRLFHRRSIDTTSEAQCDWSINKYRCTYLYIASVNWLTTRPDVMVQRYLRRATLTLLKHRIAALLTYSEKTKWKQQRRWDFCNSICIERLVNLRYPQYPEYVADHLQKFIELLLGP